MDENLDIKVFVVDDDLPSRLALDSILRSVGYKVELFSSGRELLDRARQGMEGCVILDVRLPGPSGLEVQRRLKEFGCDIPIVFVTGHGDISMAVQAIKAQAVEFLTKPFRDQDLLDAVATALEVNGAKRHQEKADECLRQRLALLTPRETEVFLYLQQGHLCKQISDKLNMSESTVKVHRRSIFSKLEVNNIGQMVGLYCHLVGLPDGN